VRYGKRGEKPGERAAHALRISGIAPKADGRRRRLGGEKQRLEGTVDGWRFGMIKAALRSTRFNAGAQRVVTARWRRDVGLAI